MPLISPAILVDHTVIFQMTERQPAFSRQLGPPINTGVVFPTFAKTASYVLLNQSMAEMVFEIFKLTKTVPLIA